MASFGRVVEIVRDNDFVASFKKGEGGEGANVASPPALGVSRFDLRHQKRAEPGDKAGSDGHAVCCYPRPARDPVGLS